MQRNILACSKLSGSRTQNQKSADCDNVRATLFQIGECSSNRGTGVDNVVHDGYTLTSKALPKRVWNSIARRKEAVFSGANEPLRVCELNIELKRYHEGHKCALDQRAADRIYLQIG